MKELTLSIFADESGGQDGTSKYCLIALVLHDQPNPAGLLIDAYRNSLAAKALPDIPFHASPLIYGKDQYNGLDLATRKKLLASFFALTRKLPIRYKTLTYRRSGVATLDRLIAHQARPRRLHLR